MNSLRSGGKDFYQSVPGFNALSQGLRMGLEDNLTILKPAYLVCLMRTLWRSLLTGACVSGHDFKTSSEKTPANVHVLECEVCGYVSIAWSLSSLENQK